MNIIEWKTYNASNVQDEQKLDAISKNWSKISGKADTDN